MKLSVNNVIKILLGFLFVLNVSDGLFTPIIAVFVGNTILGASLSTVGFSIAIYSISKSIVQIPVARWLDTQITERIDFYVLLTGVVIGIVFPLALIFTTTITMLYLLFALTCVGAACLMASFYALFNDHIDKDRASYEWSLFSVGGLTISSAIGGAVGGVIADYYGFKTLFLISAILYAVGGSILLFLYPHISKFRIPKVLSAETS
ncbi:MAG: MFS transporter [bacterium]|nr:MFS transporter [bacterium]